MVLVLFIEKPLSLLKRINLKKKFKSVIILSEPRVLFKLEVLNGIYKQGSIEYD